MLRFLFIWSILILHLLASLFGRGKYVTDCDSETKKCQMANNNYQLCVDQCRVIKNHPYAPRGLRQKAEDAKEIAFNQLAQELETYSRNGNTDLVDSKTAHPCLIPETYGDFHDIEALEDDEISQELSSSLSKGIPILRTKRNGKLVYILDNGQVISAKEWKRTKKYLKPDQPWKLAYNNYQHCLEHWNLIKSNPTPPSNLLLKAEVALKKAHEQYIEMIGIRDNRLTVPEFGKIGEKISNNKVDLFKDVKHHSSRYWSMLRSAVLLAKGRTKKPVLDK